MTRLAHNPVFRFASRLHRDTGGNVAMIFGITAIPMLMTAGIVVDYGVNSATRAQVQNALDATTLSLAKLPASLSDSELSTRATKQVTAALANSQLNGLTVSMARSGDSITVTVTGTTPTTLTRIAGFQSLPIHIVSIARRGATNMEIALVLDNTGSMKGAKIANLKSAATQLIQDLFSQADPSKPNSVKMSIVPFSNTVNVGAGNIGASWLDQNGLASYHSELFSAPANRFSLFATLNVPWAGCVETRPMPYDVTDVPASSGTPDTLFVPAFAPDESDTDTSTSNNYLVDTGASSSATNRERQALLSKYTNASWNTSSSSSSGYKRGPNWGCGLQAITPLTNQQATLTTAIANMTVGGETNIPMGLIWGWHAISPNSPLVSGVPYSDKTTHKYVVLMTDGLNNNKMINSSNGSNYSGIGYIWEGRIGISSVTSSTDARTAALDGRLSTLCTNMKNAGIDIFTIRVEVTEGTSDLLKNCASNPSMFYDVADSSGLAGVFKSIGTQLSELRLSR